jgi:D-alanyl-lipoteichoic acid acyltransferase DltB (MBOAT superfamily)
MLFNSFVFLFIFLPFALVTYYVAARFNYRRAAAAIGLSSLLFYAWWDYRFVFLLLGSIVVNYAVGRRIGGASAAADRPRARALLVTGLVIDLAVLGFFKYAGLLNRSVTALTGTVLPLPDIVLPLGISFYTFTQIAFLVDAYYGKVDEYDFVYYLAFVTYFPHQIAGPILHHREMIGQFRRPTFGPSQVAVGLTIFALGLFKKMVLADGVADFATPVFTAADAGNQMMFFEAWLGTLAYAFQIYFDFSGYCDMAIGLSLLFGIKLPLNFDSPYKSVSITEFWRRWHMTLSRFLRDYLYIPLGGNRRGAARRYANLLATMILGGLWHGANWTFAAWGLLHGVYLVINHAWRGMRPRVALLDRVPLLLRQGGSWGLTMAAVLIAWVFFRAATFSGAGLMLRAMSGLNGISLEPGWTGSFGPRTGVGLLMALLVICVCLPNTQEWLRSYSPALGMKDPAAQERSLTWRPTVVWAVICGVLFAIALNRIGGYSEFLYFNF